MCQLFGQVIFRKIIWKLVTTRFHIFKLQCTKFDFGCGSAQNSAGEAYNAPPDSLAKFKRPAFIRKKKRGRWENERDKKSSKEKRKKRKKKKKTNRERKKEKQFSGKRWKKEKRGKASLPPIYIYGYATAFGLPWRFAVTIIKSVARRFHFRSRPPESRDAWGLLVETTHCQEPTPF